MPSHTTRFGASSSSALGPERLLALALLLISACALLGALYAQFVAGLAPCILCLYQRVPWVIVAILAAVAFQPALPAPWRRGLLGLAALAFLGNAGLAFFHVGVEQGWWAGTDACGAPAGGGSMALSSPSDLRAALSQPQAAGPRCDEPAWDLFGITMAGYNMLISLFLGLATGLAVARAPWWSRTAP